MVYALMNNLRNPLLIVVRKRRSDRWHHQSRFKVSNSIDFMKLYREGSPTCRIALRTGLYISAFGLSLAIAPKTVMHALQFQSIPAAGWIRVGGILSLLFGFYYIGASFDDYQGNRPTNFYFSTIIGRTVLSLCFLALVAAKQVEKSLLILAAINVLSLFTLLSAL